MAVIAPADLRTAFTEAGLRLRGMLGDLTEEVVRAPSALPGWTRGHVLTHVEGVGRALARQASCARRGVLVELYDGGRPARDAAIEAGHGRSAGQLTAAVHDALDEVDAAWSAVGPADWERPVRYREGVLLGAGLAWWRELEIHTSDALLGHGTSDWSQPFCAHLLNHLAPRLPDGVRLTLSTPDGPWTLSGGPGDGPTGLTELNVTGRLTDLSAWLAGRTPAGPLTGDPLPPLADWP